MSITSYLKGQLTSFVECYQKFFKITYGIAVTFTLICFVFAALLFRFSDFDKSVISKQISLLSYFFHRYSLGETYSIVDLIKSVFIFFVSIFSIGLTRFTNNVTKDNQPSFKSFLARLNLKDISYLLGVLILTSLIDVVLFKLDTYSSAYAPDKALDKYFSEWIFNLRIYIPLILFSLTIRSLTIHNKTKITFKRILFLYISVWLFNEFAFEFSVWVRTHLLRLVLIPFVKSDYFYLFESFLGIPLIAFYFLGYHSAMTTSLELTEQD